jgi:hypothetical protein
VADYVTNPVKKKKRKKNKINPMFNFWFSEFVIPIVVTCPPSPQTTDIDEMKLGQTFLQEKLTEKTATEVKTSRLFASAFL